MTWFLGRAGNNTPAGAPGGGMPVGAANDTIRFNGVTGLWEASTILTNDGLNIQIPVQLQFTSSTQDDVIRDLDSNILIQMNVFAQNDTSISTDLGVLNDGYLYVGSDIVELFGAASVQMGLYGQNLLIVSSATNDFNQGGFGSHMKVGDNSAIALGSSAIDRAATWIGNRSSTFAIGVVNSVAVGGSDTDPKTSQSAYVQQIAFNEASALFETIINADTATADRLVTIPDADGEVSVLDAGIAVSGDTPVYDGTQMIRYGTQRILGSGSVTIASGVTVVVATFVRNALERIKAPEAFITDNVATAQLNYLSPNIIFGISDDIFMWYRRTAVANTVELVMKNQNAPVVPRTVEWLVEGIVP